MFLKKVLLSTLVFSGLALAQGTINTYAGNDALFEGSGQPAIAAQLVGPNNSVVDGQGNVYFSASGLAMVLKISAATGVISVFAGNGLSRFAGDGGLAVGASLSSPQGLAFDSAGDLFIADSGNHRVREVTPAGIITTVAGGGNGGDGGLATQAGIEGPQGVVLDKSGNLYFVDYGANLVRMVSASTGIISTLAGTSSGGFTGDGGPATQATLSNPSSITIDSSGNLYIADTYASRIRKFFPGGIITTVAGGGSSLGDNGPATQAQLNAPQGVAVDASGDLYIADSYQERIRRVGANGIITTIAGTGQAGFSGDGSLATGAMFSTPVGVAVDASGNVYVADLDNNRIRRVVPGGTVTTIAGTTTPVGDGGPSRQARLTSPQAVAVDSAGNLFIADPNSNRVRKVTPSGIITTLAGTGQTGRGGDNGPAASAILNNPAAVAVDSAGNVYIVDSGNSVIRRVDATTGKITLFAGNYTCCYLGTGTSGDGGPATAATLFAPHGVAVDGVGNVYFATVVANGGKPGLLSGPNGAGEAVLRVTTDGIIHPWAGGTQAGAGFSGDGGPPLQAVFGGNINLAAASDGTLYIADQYNNRARKIDPAGATINTVVGNGQGGYAGDGGPATAAAVQGLYGIALDAEGNLYVGAYSYVRKVNSSGIIGPYVDNGQQYGFSGDGGPATAASIEEASGLAVDSGNNLYIADVFNLRVRQVQPAAPPAIDLSSTSIAFSLAATGSTATTQTFVLTNSGQGTLNWAAAATTTSGGPWLSVSPATGSILSGQPGTTVRVTANPSGLAAGDYYGQIQVSSPNAASPVQMVTVRFTVQTAGETPPQVFAGGTVSDASYSAAPVTPGTLAAIFGMNFTDSTTALVASGYPWPNQLGGTSVTIGGEPVPLYVVTAGQLVAALPFDLPVNTSLPIVVTRNNAVSAPQPVSVIADQPGVFTQAESGLGIGAIEIFRPDGSYEGVAGNGNSATAGDVVVIYCTGLGGVNPRAVAGYPAPPSPLSHTIDPVTMTIGGVNVPVFFAGLAPGYAGLYQVNGTIPGGIAPNPTAPLVLTQGGQKSPTVTIPMQ
jgi:uncharacterized protein (TIGR03437 family)